MIALAAWKGQFKSIMDLLKEETIFLNLEFESADEILRHLCDVLVDKKLVKPEFTQKILEREEQFPTGIEMDGFGVALPHTEVRYVNEDSLIIATLKSPITFGLMGMEGKGAMNLIIMPVLSGHERHLEVLSEISLMLSNFELLKKLAEAKTKAEIIALLNENLRL